MRAFQISALIETAVRDERERGIIRSNALEDAARQALEALANPWEAGAEGVADAIVSLRAALAEPEQEPVAWMDEHGHVDHGWDAILDPTGWTPLYAAPPQRKPLRTVIYACPICAASLERQE